MQIFPPLSSLTPCVARRRRQITVEIGLARQVASGGRRTIKRASSITPCNAAMQHRALREKPNASIALSDDPRPAERQEATVPSTVPKDTTQKTYYKFGAEPNVKLPGGPIRTNVLGLKYPS